MLSLCCQNTLLKACSAGIIAARPALLHAHQALMARPCERRAPGPLGGQPTLAAGWPGAA